ncbi:MAG: hypothetical protein ACE1Y4_14735, partial [Lysobacterales bacterium]
MIVNTTESYVDSGSDVSTANGNSVGITAVDTSLILANAGGSSFSGSGGAIGGVSLSSGAASEVNTINNNVRSYVSNSILSADGGLELNALSESKIWSLTTAGAGAGSGGAIGGVSVSGAGAGSVNIIVNTVESYIENGSTISSGSGKDIKLSAIDRSAIMANAGGASASGSGGVAGGVAVSSGSATAVSDITNTVRAYISGSTVNSGGGVELYASSEASIWALSLGGAFSGSGGAVGASVAGAGSVATNIIHNTVEAYIKNSSDVSTSNGKSLLISAQDKADIQANAAAQSISFIISVTGAAVSIGTVISVNEIGNTVQAYIEDSKIVSAGEVNILATSTSTVDSKAVATAIAAGVSPGGLGVAGTGATASNKIEN